MDIFQNTITENLLKIVHYYFVRYSPNFALFLFLFFSFLFPHILKFTLFSFFQGIYVTEVHEGSPAAKSGLRMHDKILQCNGYDFTMVTHKKAVGYIRKHPVLNLLVARKGVTST